MKTTKQLLSLCLALLLCLALAGPVSAEDSAFVVENGVLTQYKGRGGDVVLPDGVTAIADYAFRDCETLTGARLPAGVTAIGDWAFQGCEGLRLVTIPLSVKSIGKNAFSGCNSLKDVYYPGNEAQWQRVKIGDNNHQLLKASVHYNMSEPPVAPNVVLTSQLLRVNGEAVTTEIYNINGSNFFKLRDLAVMLNGTGSQFSVEWDAASGTIAVKTGRAYTPVGGELTLGRDSSGSAEVSRQKLTVNGEAVELTAWNIGGSNFFKLRDLGEALNFGVDYDAEAATILVTSR